MKKFVEHLQEEVGYYYTTKEILQVMDDDEVSDSIERYIKFRNQEVLKLAKENARFESGSDKTGFIYITQLQELLNIK